MRHIPVRHGLRWRTEVKDRSWPWQKRSLNSCHREIRRSVDVRRRHGQSRSHCCRTQRVFSLVDAIERIVGTDVGRGIQRLVHDTSGNLYKAAESLASHPAPHVAILSGFYIPKAGMAETDGPLGASQLAAALMCRHIPVTLLTDRLCHDAVSVALRKATRGVGEVKILRPDTKQRLAVQGITHLISIECAGPSATGEIYNMRGEDITATSPDVHSLFIDVPWTTIGVGDGGNEIGMGAVSRSIIAEDVQNGETIACVTPCDRVIVAGVSNWGAWGLIAALMLVWPEWTIRPCLEPDFAYRILEKMVRYGPAVDGVTLKATCTVDGMDWEFHNDVLNRLLCICDTARDENNLS